jgi:hypothetical protein
MSEEEEQEQENKTGFKVKDRRRFDAEGESRDSDTESSDASARGDEAGSGAGSEHAASSEPVAPDMPDDDLDGIALEEGGGLTFSGFVIGLAQQAFMFLGVIPDPQSAVVHKDLLQARAMIDILEMLRDKTRGNLEEVEERMMEEMLEELHLQYVREVQGSMNPQGDSQ